MIRPRGLASRARIARSSISLAVVLVATVGPSATARALHEAVESAIALADDADFAGAMAALDAAEARDDLDRDDVIALFAHRALVCFARGDRAAMERDLARLVALDRDAVLPAAAPPPVRDAFAAIRSHGTTPIAISAQAVRRGRVTRVHATVDNDAAGLVRAIRVSTRLDDRAWTTHAGETVEVASDGARSIAYVVDAIGPGGAVIASLGTRDRPRVSRAWTGPIAGAASTRSRDGTPMRSRDGTRRDARGSRSAFPWWTIAVGAGAATAIGVVVAVVASSASTGGGDRTALGGPTLELD